MSSPWLSIVIPAYNAENFLPACLTSVDPTSHPDVEVIIVDDGSTDGTPMMCDAFAAEYTNVHVIHRENGGPPAARNAGCARSTGNWVWFVDSDDLISPYALDTLKPLAEATGSEAIQIEFIRFSDGKEPAWPAPKPFDNPTHMAAPDFIAGLYRGSFQHYAWSFLLRADTLLSRSDHGFPFREEFSLYEDVVSIEQIIRCVNSVETCQWRFYGYRQSAGSMSHRRSNSASDSGIRAVRDLQRYRVGPELAVDKARMEVGLLFTAYRIAEQGSQGNALRRKAREEIERRVREVGPLKLGRQKLARYVLLESGLMDKVIDWRDRG